MPSLLAVQTHPKHWTDPLLWQPSRWILPSASEVPHNINIVDTATRLSQETLVEAKQSTFFPWSDRPQDCPCKTFAQVEFVAVLACLLRDHRINVIMNPGESFPAARNRLLATTEDCDMELLLRMRNADRVRVECRPVSNHQQFSDFAICIQ